MLYALKSHVRAIKNFYPELIKAELPEDDGTPLGHQMIVLFEAARYCTKMRLMRSPDRLIAAIEAQDRFLEAQVAKEAELSSEGVTFGM